jgi:DNA-binding HxlR family transcriptional regulator
MSDTYSQGCPIAVALDTIGDRWMLLLLRDLAHAPMRYSDLQAINPKISPNLLSKRLRQLQDAGLVSKRVLPPPGAATVYELAPEARAAVLPVLNALGRFGHICFRPPRHQPMRYLSRCGATATGYWPRASTSRPASASSWTPTNSGSPSGRRCSSPPASRQSSRPPPSNQTRSP